VSIGDDFGHFTIGDFPNCTCYVPWHGVLPKPPCPMHGFVQWTWPSTTTGVKITTTTPDDEPVYDGPTEEFVLTLGLTPGYDKPTNKLKPKLAVATFLEFWHEIGSGDTIPVRVRLERVGYPGGEEDIFVATGTRNPYWMPDPVAWRQNVLYYVRAMKKHYQQTTAQITFSPTHLVYYRTED
jgi:hypothetical protein